MSVVTHGYALDINISDKAGTLGRGIGIGKSSLLLALPAVVFLSVTPVSTELMRGNQLSVSAARWQHGSQICFATFIY